MGGLTPQIESEWRAGHDGAGESGAAAVGSSLAIDVEDSPVEAALRSHVACLVAEGHDTRGNDLPAPIDGGERVGRRAAREAQIDQCATGDVTVLRGRLQQRGEIEVPQVDCPLDPPLGHREVRYHVATQLPRRGPGVEHEAQTAERAFRADLERRLQRVSKQRGHQPASLPQRELLRADPQVEHGCVLVGAHAAVDRQGALGCANRKLLQEDRVFPRGDRPGQVGEAEVAIGRLE